MTETTFHSKFFNTLAFITAVLAFGCAEMVSATPKEIGGLAIYSPLTASFSKDTTQGNVEVENTGDTTRVFDLKVVEVSVDKDGKTIEKVAKDFRFASTRLIVEPKTRIKVPFYRTVSGAKGETAYKIALTETASDSFAYNFEWHWFFRDEKQIPLVVSITTKEGIIVRNDGTATAQLKNLKVGKDLVKQGLVGYLYPGEEKLIPADLSKNASKVVHFDDPVVALLNP